eukprot:CAMPEP_0119011756 /NCGR_PEP_ID=MMETSP1176-20130426/5871_1 /TAXON_ID=265551 /ORGANISM="Synedropsis recta cf, Strain CCMP1620" /LENGTH=297 /DNA_ID=CAMNT_0006964617 /DNA_START=1 /DNA_END=894 /DNA_ORIENTATION=+
MMNCLLIAFTLVIGLASDTNALAVGEPAVDDPIIIGEPPPDEGQFFEIVAGVEVPDHIFTRCSQAEKVLIGNELNQLLIPYRFGDAGDINDPASGICDNKPPYDPNDPTGGNLSFAYVWYRSGACTYCGSMNADARMLYTTAKALASTVKSAIETTLLPNHPNCFGTKWTVIVSAEEVTAADIEVNCPLPITKPPVDPLVDDPITKPPVETVEWKYELPDWWKTVNKIKKCKKLQGPPAPGTKCKKAKTCYWGNQLCDGGLVAGEQKPAKFPYPSISCSCDGSTWSCVKGLDCPETA